MLPHAFAERGVLKLRYAARIRASDAWRGAKVTEFELRQLDAAKSAQQSTRRTPRTPHDFGCRNHAKLNDKQGQDSVLAAHYRPPRPMNFPASGCVRPL